MPIDDTKDPIPEGVLIRQDLVPALRMAPGAYSKITSDEIRIVRSVNHKSSTPPPVVFLIDHFFDADTYASHLGAESDDIAISLDTSREPTTDFIDSLVQDIRAVSERLPAAIIGMGGGSTMDSSKAVSNLLTNGGRAEHYQGWDLVSRPGVFKAAVPTISGTGAESSRTCVLSNPSTHIKLGMNSPFSLNDLIVLDPELSLTVPRNQYFFTGMDTYMHNIESLNGRYRNPIADSFARESLRLVRRVFDNDDMMSITARTELMISSYLGGTALAGSYVGLIHPMSAALSVVLGTHHGVSNCIVMRAMKDYYPAEYEEFWRMANTQEVHVPTVNGHSLTQNQLDQLVASTLVHERPLSNALGLDFRKILGGGRLEELFAML